MELDGLTAGWTESVEGGQAIAEVVVEPPGHTRFPHKHIGGVRYEDITVNCGTGMSREFYDWIKQSMAGAATTKNGAITTVSVDSGTTSSMEFVHGLISGIGFPTLDAGSKDVARLTVKIAPESTRHKVLSGGADTVGRGEQKKWLVANFRLDIDGLDTSRVARVESLFVGLANPGLVETPNLVITLPEANAADFVTWHEDFVINGNNGRDKTKSGTLEFLSADLKASLITLRLSGLGIFKLTPEKTEAGSENVRRVKVEMYCEEIRLENPP